MKVAGWRRLITNSDINNDTKTEETSCRVCGNTKTCFFPGPNVWICDECMKKVALEVFKASIKRINEPARQAVA